MSRELDTNPNGKRVNIMAKSNSTTLLIAGLACIVAALGMEAYHGHYGSLIRGIFLGLAIVLMIMSLRSRGAGKDN